MPNLFPPAEVAEAQRRFGHTAVQPIRSGLLAARTAAGASSPPATAAPAIEGIVLSFLNLKVCDRDLVVSLQFRVVPFRYPESFPTFFLVSPRSYRLIPEVYKTNLPQAAIQQTTNQDRDDPKKVGWEIGGDFPRVHFCQLEEIWEGRPLGQRNLCWGLTQLHGLLQNPTRARLLPAAAR